MATKSSTPAPAPAPAPAPTLVTLNGQPLPTGKFTAKNQLAQANHTGKVYCQYCGKLLTGNAANLQTGNLCLQHAQAGFTPASLLAKRVTAATPPTGYIKLASLGRTCKAKGIPISRLVNAIGKDRCINGPMAQIALPVYVGSVRWVNSWLATPAGLQAIATGNFSKAPKPKNAK